MRTITVIVAFCASILLVQCAASNAVSYDYPEDIKEVEKKDFVTQFEKGRILYKISCAKCHNITVDGKPVIPDFSLPQLMDYEVRIQYPAHAEDLRETNVSEQELNMIVHFLRYKQKNKAVVKK